jgi:alpha-1,3-rhamnosyl/mannosyltransferase
MRSHGGGRAITSIYDAISFVYPKLAPSARDRLLIRLFHTLAIARSQAVITISQSAAHDLTRTFPAIERKLVVTPLAADAIYAPRDPDVMQAVRRKFNIVGEFAFYIASNKPHKNLPRLIEAWALAKQPGTLIVAGHQDPRYPQAERRARELGLASVRFIGSISDDDAAALHSTCAVFVYPSLYEGFGLTPLEAMTCGAPIVCSNASSLPEVIGDAGLLVDPLSPPAIAAALRRIFDDPALRAELRSNSLKQAARFRWERTAADTIAVYRRQTAVDD